MKRIAMAVAAGLGIAAMALAAQPPAPPKQPEKKTETKPEAKAEPMHEMKHEGKGPEGKTPLAVLRKLEGRWETEPAKDSPHGEDGEVGVLEYKVISNGSVVVEHEFPGTGNEMQTVYFMNGDNLMGTHYCAIGNQPTMKAAPWKEGDKTLNMEFVSATNMEATKEMGYMGSVKFTFKDADHFTIEYTHYDSAGKETEKMPLDMHRVKDKPAGHDAGKHEEKHGAADKKE